MAGPQPLRYDPSYETPQPDEADTAQQLVETMRGICETTFKDDGHAGRGVHAKSHGLLHGTLRVLDGLPPELAQGAFAKPASYPVVMRFSTNPGDILDDSISAPRGLAVKIIGVEGERLPGSEGEVTQDFVMANAPAFSVPDPKGFLTAVRLMAKTTDTPQIWKKAFSATLRGVEALVERAGGESATLISFGGQALTQILGNTFYTAAPLLWGPYMAKLSVAPVSPNLLALVDKPIDVSGRPNALRDSVSMFFTGAAAEWEVRVQLCTDLATMPIEDTAVLWPEDQSPYVPVARITVPPQPGWNEQRAALVDDGFSFSPWHGLAAHRPIGAIMRSRRTIYKQASGIRSRLNGCPLHEPRNAAALQGLE